MRRRSSYPMYGPSQPVNSVLDLMGLHRSKSENKTAPARRFCRAVDAMIRKCRSKDSLFEGHTGDGSVVHAVGETEEKMDPRLSSWGRCPPRCSRNAATSDPAGGSTSSAIAANGVGGARSA